MSDRSAEPAMSGDEVLAALVALANPHRLRLVAALVGERDYVSNLSRRLGISRPLLHMHLRRLEAVGLVHGTHEVSADGKALRYVELNPFTLTLSPESIAFYVSSLTDPNETGTQQEGSE